MGINVFFSVIMIQKEKNSHIETYRFNPIFLNSYFYWRDAYEIVLYILYTNLFMTQGSLVKQASLALNGTTLL